MSLIISLKRSSKALTDEDRSLISSLVLVSRRTRRSLLVSMFLSSERIMPIRWVITRIINNKEIETRIIRKTDIQTLELTV